jgi:hypothetical protein
MLRKTLVVAALLLILDGGLAAEDFRGAKIKKKSSTFWGYEITFTSGKKDRTVHAILRATKAYEADGKPVNFMPAARSVFSEGSVVDITTETIDGKAMGKEGKVEIASKIRRSKK